MAIFIRMDFKNLIVYQKALQVYAEIRSHILVLNDLDRSLKDQLRRASLSIVLNIAEGSSRFSAADRKNFFVIARGSVFECAAILDVVSISTGAKFITIDTQLVEISKILYKMIDTLRDRPLNESVSEKRKTQNAL
jgi:four helix bundle protein